MLFHRLHDCCTIRPSTRLWINGWLTMVINFVWLIVFGFIIPNGHFEELLQYLCNQRICKLIAVIKGMELLFSVILLVGVYTGKRTLIFTWIVAAASITGASLIVFPGIILFTPYHILPTVFTFTAACQLYHVISAIHFYNYKEAEYDCAP